MSGFKKGQSGNPQGRPKGIVTQAKLRQSIEKDLPEIIGAMVEAAKGGDVAAARMLVDKVLPSVKAQDQAVSLPVDGSDLAKDGRAIMSAVGLGEVTPETASRLLQGLGSLAKIIETAELLERVEALEDARANQAAS